MINVKWKMTNRNLSQISNRKYQISGFGLLSTDSSVLNLRPVDRKIEVRIIGFLVALDAANWSRHKTVAFPRVGGVVASGTVTLLALDVGELRCRIQRLEPAFLKAYYVTPDAFVVELLVLLLQRSHSVTVPTLDPHIVFLLVTTGAGLNPDIR